MSLLLPPIVPEFVPDDCPMPGPDGVPVPLLVLPVPALGDVLPVALLEDPVLLELVEPVELVEPDDPVDPPMLPVDPVPELGIGAGIDGTVLGGVGGKIGESFLPQAPRARDSDTAISAPQTRPGVVSKVVVFMRNP